MAHMRVCTAILSARSDEVTQIIRITIYAQILSASSIFLMKHREQSNEISTGTRPFTGWMCPLMCTAKVLFYDATNLQCKILLINMISHIATAVDHEVSQISYMAPSSETATIACSNRNILLIHA